MLSRADLYVLGGVAVVVVGAGWWAARKVAQLPAGSFNPASASNLAYRGANAIGAAAAGDDGFNLGRTLFEWLNPSVVQEESRAVYGTRGPNGEGLPAVEPALIYTPGALGNSPFVHGA